MANDLSPASAQDGSGSRFNRRLALELDVLELEIGPRRRK
jgi:hypothetical protein